MTVTSTFDAATDQALRNFQTSRGLPVTGTTDALTWQAVLGLAGAARRLDTALARIGHEAVAAPMIGAAELSA